MNKPSRARVDVVRVDYFGTVVEDPYRWMEDVQSEESRAFIEEHGAYARAYLDALPGREELLARVRELRDVVPFLYGFRVAGGRTFYLRRDPENELARLVVRVGPNADERTLFDPNAVQGEAHTAIDWYAPSNDGRLVAYGISQGGSEKSTLYVMDVDRGEQLPDVITRTQLSSEVTWLDDNRSFLYHRMNELGPDASPHEEYLNSRSYLHHLGADPESDPPVIGSGLSERVEIPPHAFPFAGVSPRSDWMLGVISHGVLNELTMYAAPKSSLTDPSSIPWRKICDVEDAVTGLAIEGDTVFLPTHKGALRFRVIASDLDAPDITSARVVVPDSDVVIQDLAIAGGYLFTRDLDEGINRLRRVSLEGGEREDVPLPFEGVIGEMASEPGSDELLLTMHSLIESPRVYRYRVSAGTLEDTGWIAPAPVNMSDIEVARTHARAKDGVPIPMTIVHRKGLVLDGSNPTLLQGYGSYGLNFPIRYQPQMLAWYERGGVLAIGHIRGGGELGKEWHEAGRLMNKRNTIDDFIACAEYLIDNGYTRPDRLAGEGTSAGGIPSGGGLVLRPDLWAVMVMRVAVTDNFRIQHTPTGPANIPEFGDATTEEGFAALRIIDSYSKVRDGVPYPAVLLTTGLNDPRVVAWQAMKMAARLQAATSSGKPVLMRVETQAGHGFGSSKRQMDEELADTLAFLLQQFGITGATGAARTGEAAGVSGTSNA